MPEAASWSEYDRDMFSCAQATTSVISISGSDCESEDLYVPDGSDSASTVDYTFTSTPASQTGKAEAVGGPMQDVMDEGQLADKPVGVVSKEGEQYITKFCTPFSVLLFSPGFIIVVHSLQLPHTSYSAAVVDNSCTRLITLAYLFFYKSHT